MKVAGYKIQDTGYRIQDTGYRIQDTGYRIQDTGGRIQGNPLADCLPDMQSQTLASEPLNFESSVSCIFSILNLVSCIFSISNLQHLEYKKELHSVRRLCYHSLRVYTYFLSGTAQQDCLNNEPQREGKIDEKQTDPYLGVDVPNVIFHF
jgi:hypothetical protein